MTDEELGEQIDITAERLLREGGLKVISDAEKLARSLLRVPETAIQAKALISITSALSLHCRQFLSAREMMSHGEAQSADYSLDPELER